MDMGQPSNERARLDALISAAAPDPLPAGQALPLLQQSGEKDAAVLGRLAYHALTGVDPGDGDPPPPGEVAPGFPPFAAEVLMRAICGPDHRRPTAQALLIVLETVPLASWPGADRPYVALGETASDTAPETVETPVVDAVRIDAPEPEVEVDEEVEELAPEPTVAAIHHDEFRSLLTPSRSVPRFDPLTDPLTDPWEPGSDDGPAPIDLGRITEKPAEEESVAEPVAEPVAEVDEVVADAEPDEMVVEVEPDLDLKVEDEDEAELVAAEEVDEADAADAPRGMHDEFRDFVSPSFAVPRFEPLEGKLPAGSDRVRRRRTRDSSRATDPEQPAAETSEKPAKAEKPTKPPKAPKPAKVHPERTPVANASSDDDRRQTLLLVGVILVLIVIGVVYAATRDSDDKGTEDPQGASRSTVQTSSVAV